MKCHLSVKFGKTVNLSLNAGVYITMSWKRALFGGGRLRGLLSLYILVNWNIPASILKRITHVILIKISVEMCQFTKIKNSLKRVISVAEFFLGATGEIHLREIDPESG